MTYYTFERIERLTLRQLRDELAAAQKVLAQLDALKQAALTDVAALEN